MRFHFEVTDLVCASDKKGLYTKVIGIIQKRCGTTMVVQFQHQFCENANMRGPWSVRQWSNQLLLQYILHETGNRRPRHRPWIAWQLLMCTDIQDWTCKSIIYMNEHHLRLWKMHISNVAPGHATGVGVQICVRSDHKSQVRLAFPTKEII